MNNIRTKPSFDKLLPMAVILLSWLAVLCVGLLAPEPMVGDEVVHYYLAVTQSNDLSVPTMTAEIPAYDGGKDVRTYPHVILWHYLAAVVLRVFGGSPVAVQVMQSLFWLQALVYSWLLFRSDDRDRAGVLVYLATLASLPACLIFGVVFYQDIPAIAQMMACFYYLRHRRLTASILFLLLAMSIKETMFVMIPVYFGLMLVAYPWREYRWMVIARMSLVSVLLLGCCVATAFMFNDMRQPYYPRVTVRQFMQKMGVDVRKIEEKFGREKPSPKAGVPVRARKKAVQQVANNPGDVRNPVNLLIYGGGLFWLIAVLGMVAVLCRVSRQAVLSTWNWAWFGCGIWYFVATAWFMRSAPDARFFLPGVPVVLVLMADLASRLLYKRVWLYVLLALAVSQATVVLGKTYQLRHVKAGIHGAIEFLKQNPPTPNRVFMYPEGNYRLFPCPHDWYMGYDKLRDFWKADNDKRLEKLQRNKIGAIVVKKWLVAPMDKDMNNLGIYPDFFVKQVAEDPRFSRIYDNQDVVIYSVSPPEQTVTNSISGVKQP